MYEDGNLPLITTYHVAITHFINALVYGVSLVVMTAMKLFSKVQ